MTECPKFEHLLVIPHVRVQNANAVSSPLTHGFPSMTAFLGLMWALERKTAASGLDLHFTAVGVVCHDYQEQITDGGHVHAFCLTRNPVDKSGSTAAIVEEGRIHLEISLVFALRSKTLTREFENAQKQERIAADVRRILDSMRIAGGSVLYSSATTPRQRPYFVPMTGTDQDCEQYFHRLKYRLLPGFTLVARDDLLEKRHKELQATDPKSSQLDAWLSLSRINACYTEKAGWENDRDAWLVPIPVGYGVLSGPHEAGTVANARDRQTPFCFVESLYSIGQWLGPHRLRSPQQLLWYADHQHDSGRYRCCNDYMYPAGSDNDHDFD
ncbi:MAG: type I-F CRISPR-associated protein Csy2 [Azoarcus sp.]|jgi:CRISPR-associated protein Csy2|nr:type I-F CRISPR-associated protein Csy2 [Azoarcus sp.]